MIEDLTSIDIDISISLLLNLLIKDNYIVLFLNGTSGNDDGRPKGKGNRSIIDTFEDLLTDCCCPS